MSDISLIPKEYKKTKVGFGRAISKIGTIAIILVILALLVYGGLLFYSSKLEENIDSIQAQIKELNQQRDEEFEKEVISVDKTLKNLKTVFKNHLYWSNIFSTIEELTVPEVGFTGFSGNISESNSVNISLTGRTSGYTYLAKQMVSFQEDDSISGVTVAGIALSTEGGIEFTLNINFSEGSLLQKK